MFIVLREDYVTMFVAFYVCREPNEEEKTARKAAQPRAIFGPVMETGEALLENRAQRQQRNTPWRGTPDSCQ
jgi:hypothetical protein